MTTRRKRKPTVLRGAGLQSPGYDFCVAFANTAAPREDRHKPSRAPLGVVEKPLANYGDLVSWGELAGALSSPEAEKLRRAAAEEPEEAAAVFERALAMRTALGRILKALVQRDTLTPEDLETISGYVVELQPRLRLAAGDEHTAWSWDDGEPTLARFLWLVAYSTAQLLTDDAHQRVRQCAGKDCTVLFVDVRQRRLWCSMASCGNPPKMRRHRRRFGS